MSEEEPASSKKSKKDEQKEPTPEPKEPAKKATPSESDSDELPNVQL